MQAAISRVVATAALAAGGATYETAPADEHHRMLSALFRLHQAIRAETSLEELAGSVVQLSRKALGARVADLWIRSGEGLRSLASTRAEDAPLAAPEEGPAGRAWREWLMVEAPGDGQDVTGLHFPLTTGADRIGVLSMEFARERRPSPQLAGFFAASAALALDSSIRFEKARSEALTDPLTGVRNRRYMENRLGEELQRRCQS